MCNDAPCLQIWLILGQLDKLFGNYFGLPVEIQTARSIYNKHSPTKKSIWLVWMKSAELLDTRDWLE